MNNTILRRLFVLTSAAIFLGTIVLNLLAIIYIRSRRDKTSIAILVVNLAIADIIHASMYIITTRFLYWIKMVLFFFFFLVGIIFFSSNLFTPSWVFGEFGCKFSLTIDVLCTVVSVDWNKFILKSFNRIEKGRKEYCVMHLCGLLRYRMLTEGVFIQKYSLISLLFNYLATTVN